jgi:hypothetical protein
VQSQLGTRDKRDRELLVSMRRKSEAIEFDLEHVPGKSEPLLRIPDQILGAYGEVVTKGPAGARRARGKG